MGHLQLASEEEHNWAFGASEREMVVPEEAQRKSEVQHKLHLAEVFQQLSKVHSQERRSQLKEVLHRASFLLPVLVLPLAV